jgi:hypothetical protein
MPLLGASTWSNIEAMRGKITGNAAGAASVEEVAQGFTASMMAMFSGIVLARLFLVVPLARLPEREQAFARGLAGDVALVDATTRVLSLLGTSGRDPAWGDRHRSQGHLAIPLVNSAFVQGVPMIAKLLADLEIDLAALDDGKPIATRRMLGGRNGAFYVPDAATALDARGRKIIAAEDFVRAQNVGSVFGMGGAYLDGTLAVAVFFTDEKNLDRLFADRFASLISTFKMATSKLLADGHIYRESPPAAV